jgi:hypothetical protein
VPLLSTSVTFRLYLLESIFFSDSLLHGIKPRFRHVVNRVAREAHTKEPLGSSKKAKYYEYYINEADMRSIH